ncbi:hypothetical protein BGZ60DRAFT_411602 [Tricladium varicosporioides]|nr:hypothetical protein BGZ60DRAFT_411602 [Hymenoscyphus varicosporioides]
MVQFVTLEEKKIYFSVGSVNEEPLLPTSTGKNRDSRDLIERLEGNDRPKSFEGEEENSSSSEHAEIVQPPSGFGNFKPKPKPIKTGSPFKDTYSIRDRKEILTSLWNNPSESDLEPLTPKQTQQKIRELALRDRIEGVKEVRRFHSVHLQAILTTQHEIIQLEKRMSRGLPIAINTLNPLLIEYANLIKSYKDLSALKQVHKDGKSFSKFFATELHEPRYWYAPDATERIDLIEDSPRLSHDIVRKVLQQKLPLRWLDAAGRAMREWDQAEDDISEDGRGQFGPVSKITSRYRSHGRYISPSVDNLTRVLFALCGGLFLLIPMVALAYIKSKTWLVVTTVLFVLGFAVMLGAFSKGTNHELIGATAAYTAVLVVFVGNSISGGKG